MVFFLKILFLFAFLGCIINLVGFLFNFLGVGGKKRNKKQAYTCACRLLYSFILVVAYYWIMKLWPMLGV